MSNDTAIISLKEKIDDLNQQAWDVRVTDMPKAFEFSQESVKLARGINYPKGLAEGLQSLGFSYLRFSKNDEAAPLLKESLSLFQSLNDLKGQAIVYEYLGIIERNWGNLGASLELLLKGNDLIQKTDPPEVEITSCYQIGVTYKHLGNHENALDYLYKTLSLAKKINFTLMEAYATNIIGSIYFDNGNYDQALDCYQQGLIIRRQSNDKWGEAGSLDNIGFTYLKLNDLDKAIDHCSQSLEICQATGDKKGEANALLHLGEIYEQAGDVKQAAGFSNESLEIRKARGDKRGETEVLLFLADLYKKRNDVEDQQIFEWLSNALKIADEVKAQDLLSKAYYNLHEYYQQKGNFKESLVQLEAHFQIEKELHKNSINQKIANLEISHKAETISQRNKELTELNEKIEKANEELKIEATLERVRSRSMAMHKSDELRDVVKVVFDKLQELNFVLDDRAVGIFIFKEGSNDHTQWFADPDHLYATSFEIPFTDHSIPIDLIIAKKSGADYFSKIYPVEEKNEYFKYLFAHTDYKHLPGEVKNLILGSQHYGLSVAFAKNSAIVIPTNKGKLLEDNEKEILKRFVKVFDQAYTRFLDLQKAEAQARETQIELALERVRARTMAMQKSDELREAVLVIYEQLQQLNFDSKACNIIIIDKESGIAQYWVSGFSQEIFPESYTVPYLDHPYQDALLKPWRQGDKYVVYEYTGKMKQSFDEIFFTQTEFRNVPEEAKKVMIGLASVTLSTAFISYGALQALGAEPLSEEKANILKRFAKVFEQTYTRFLDLQKAEAQAREAQIQLALERVRARTMAMQNSNELAEIVDTVFKELTKLHVLFDRCLIMIFDLNTNGSTWWLANPEPGAGPTGLFVSYHENKPYLDFINAWQKRILKWEYVLEGTNKKEWDDYLFNKTELSLLPKPVIAGMSSFDRIYLNVSFNNFGNLTVSSAEPLHEEQFDILLRFAKVFDSSYTRFNDLKQAEAQARESQIEAALERVRSRTMGMQKSEELKEVIQVVYEQFVHLNINVEHTGFVMDYKARDDYDIWIADQLGVPSHVTIPYFDCVYYNRFNEAKKKGEDFFATNLDLEEKNRFYQKIIEYVPGLPEETKDFLFSIPGLAGSTVLLENVGLYIENFAGTPFSDEENKILMRFGKVFQQTYTRFLDLQKAEAQAREAQIEAALEKVRSRTLAMQKSDELAETAAEVFRQLIALGIEPNRLYIGIVKEETGDMEMWATDEDGTQVGKRFMFNKNENASVLKLYDGWKTQKKSVIVDMQGKELEDYFHYLNNVMHIPFKGGLTQKRRVQSVAYFSKGFIGMASPDGQGDETIQLLERFAAVFNLTFTRFNDLKIAEAHAVQAKEDLVKLQTEKKRAEDALSELQVTQKQLIQSEKMASLGELTAGIAHEIQNPLNFVNNFSDVNKELLGEMKEEIEKGNIDEVIAIANDIISNEEKINHHGKRADAIVKGMLQHSRSSSGVKEPTDINELADEYLRLAYHGLRAKDKSFNAKFETDFDKNIEKINIIPQDIGRVLVNLMNNAFYAVNEKKKQVSNGYEPTVTVITKHHADKIELRVIDNGNGVPQKILDKIFQPFFTTKPTGQGTGLGLSLSYDIIKQGHGGELKVETNEGKGTQFIILLPVSEIMQPKQ